MKHASAFKPLSISTSVVPIAVFKAQASGYLERLRKDGQPVIITQHGKPAAVVLSTEEYDRIQYKEYVLREIALGEADVEAGRVMETETAIRKVEEARKTRRVQGKK